MNQFLNMVRRKRLGYGLPPGGLKVIGLNSTESVTFSHAGYYTNLWNAIQPDFHFESGPALPADALGIGWVINNIPAGSKYWSYLVNNMPGDVGTWKPGLYHILWEGGADATMSLVASSFVDVGSLTRLAPGHWTFNTTGLNVNDTNNYLQIHTENTTGAPLTRLNFHTEAIVHDDHLALWQSGSWDRNVNPDYLAWAGANVGRFRMAKVSGTENSRVTTDVLRGLITEDWKHWGQLDYIMGPPGNEYGGIFQPGPPYGSYTTGMPYSFGAKLCAKLGQAILHASIPVGASDDFLAAVGTQIASVSQFTGQILGEMGNENWGGYTGPDGQSTFGWLNSVYITQYNAPPYSANLQNGRESEAHVQLRCRKQLIAGGLAANRVIPAYCCQYIIPSSYGPIMFTLNYRDANNTFGYGVNKAFKTILNENYGAFCAAPYNTPAMPDGTWLFNANFAQYDWQNQTDAQISAFFAKGQDNITSYTAQICADVVSTIGPNVQRLCYEWGHQLNGSCSGIVGLNIQFNVSVAHSTILFNVAGQLAGVPTVGDQWAFYQNTDDGYKTPNNLGHDSSVYLRPSTTYPGEYYAYLTKADAVHVYADDAQAKAAAIVFFDNGNTLPFLGGPITRIQQASVRIQAWLDSQPGADMYQALFANTAGPNLWQQVCQLNDVGSYTSNIHQDGEANASAKAYGLNKSIYAARTPRLDYYLSRTSFNPNP